MSVKDCQEMILTGDYTKICRSNTINPIIKLIAKKHHALFIEKMQELFSGEDIRDLISLDLFLQGMRLKRDNMIRLHDGLELCYGVKDVIVRDGKEVANTEKIRVLNNLKTRHREMFFRYPELVNMDAGAEEQKKQTKAVLDPIKSQIKRLEYKIKEATPKKDKSEDVGVKQLGLALHISFIEAVENNGYLDRDMPVSELKFKYDEAVRKNNQLKQKQNG